MNPLVIIFLLTVPLGRQTAAAATPAGAATGTPGWIAAAGATNTTKTACTLHMQGFGDKPGIKAFQLSCTGGTVTAKAHKVLKQFLGSNLPIQGVTWTEDTYCRPVETGCLLTICGQSDVVFANAKITGVKKAPGSSAYAQGDKALCVSQSSRVTLRNCIFSSSTITPLSTFNSTSVLLDRCNYTNNNMTEAAVSSGVWLRNGTVVVRSSTFMRNMGRGMETWGTGSTISVSGDGRVAIVDSTFTGNTAERGGAMYVSDRAHATIYSSRFEANNASTWGGAIYARGQAKIDILPGTARTVFVNNTGTTGAGDIGATTEAAVNISGALLAGASGRWGGSIQLDGNSTISLVDTTFQKGWARKDGGCVRLDANATARIVNSTMLSCMADGNGGGIALAGTARLDLIKSMVTADALNNGGGVRLDENATAQITNSTVSGCRADADGGGFSLAGSARLDLINSTVRADALRSGGSGGCVRLDDNVTTGIINSNISGCRADAFGGGISMARNARLKLINSSISSNAAGFGNNGTAGGVGGGVHAQDASRVELQGTTLHNNTAPWGGGLAVVANATLVVQGPMQSQVVNNKAKLSGGGLRLSSTNYSATELAGLLNVANNSAPQSPNISFGAKVITVVDDGGADSVISSDTSETMLVLKLNVSGPYGVPSEDPIGCSLFRASNGAQQRSFNIVNITTTKDNFRLLQVGFKLPPGDYRLDIASTRSVEVQTTVNITIIPCPKGYVNGGRGDTCNPCAQGMYSFSATDATCSLCPPNAQCPGVNTVFPEAGFWQSAPQSVQIHRCFNAKACHGAKALNSTDGNNGTTDHVNGTDSISGTRRLQSNTSDAWYKTAQCSDAYQGNLCGECRQGYGKVRPFLCRKCMPAAAIVTLYLLAAVVMIGIVKVLVFFQTAADLALRTDLRRPIPAEMLRALIIHAQWLYIIGNLDVPLPQSLLYPVQVIGGIWSSTSGSSLGLECILSTTSRVPVAMQKVLICLFTPAGIVCAVLIIEAVLHFLRKSGNVGHDFASVVMCIVFMFLPIWVNTALSLFTCVTLDKPIAAPYQAEAVGSWWVEDMSQLCYSRSGYHRGWALGLGIPLTLLFCVALPAGVFVFMWYSRKQGKLQDMQFQKHYGFMYRLWRDEWCWWEAVVLLQTCALVMVSTFGFSLGPFYQTIVTAAVLAWIAIALLAVRPYKCPEGGRVAVIGVCVLFFTAYACLTFIPYNNAGPGAVYSNIMGAVIIIANVVFLVRTTWLLVQSVDWVAVRGWFDAGCCGSLSRAIVRDGVAGSRTGSAATAGTQEESRESVC